MMKFYYLFYWIWNLLSSRLVVIRLSLVDMMYIRLWKRKVIMCRVYCFVCLMVIVL